ncbi:galactose oxidase [Gymnopus androsaceus JB14]|uniref:Galactose oxidase n=1 Tax=Gymnopus androsaceus JB14 TaxID=1447944 RepID=A0A6A4I6E5_9AGAR|nr:galactose oxidase [Gymnopus androsaceus JB14]
MSARTGTSPFSLDPLEEFFSSAPNSMITENQNDHLGGTISPQQSPQSSTPAPWSARRLDLPPSLLKDLDKRGVVPPTNPSPPPFPRYGHALPATASRDGELYLFGGMVRGAARNDLYLLHARELSATLLQTAGEIPSPRIRHTSAIINNALIVWGGDTKTDSKSRQGDKRDNGLYLLNLQTKEWIRVAASGPVCRYGHTMTVVDNSKCIIFGGQDGGKFFNDLWSFDLDLDWCKLPSYTQRDDDWMMTVLCSTVTKEIK